MKDRLSNIRKLPKNIANVIGKLMVDRMGLNDKAYMITKDIVGYIRPNELYEISQVTKVDHSMICDLVNKNYLKSENKQEINLSKTSQCVPPKHICVDGHWDKEEFIKETGANILGGLGTFTSSLLDQIELPVITASNESLSFYNAGLVAVGERLSFTSTIKLPLILMEVGETYAKDYLMQEDYGHGAYLEYHDQPHFWLPLSSDCKGFIILGKETNGKFFLTGFRIPYGYAVYAPPYVIHADSYLIGEFLIVYMTASDYSTVILKQKENKLVPIIPVHIEDKQHNIANSNYDKFRMEIRNGNFDNVKQLLEIEEVKKDIAANDNAAFREAALNGHLDIVNLLLEDDSVLELIDVFENGALALSSKNGHIDIVKRLLEFKAVQNNIAAANNKSLDWAASNGHLDVVNELLKFEAVINKIAVADNQILRETVKSGYFKVVDRLLEFDDVKKMVAVFYNEALREAIKNGSLEIVDKLLTFEAVQNQITDDINNKEILWIVNNGHLDVINRMLQIDIVIKNIASLDNAIFRNVAAKGYLDVVDRLLQINQVRQNVDAVYNDALIRAATNGHLDVVDRLLEFTAVKSQIAICDNGALCGAVKNGHLDIVNKLIKIETVRNNIVANDNNIFREAVMNNHNIIIDILLTFPEVGSYESKYQFREKWLMLNK